ncbi:MAG TPA: hypothetical protein VLJ59_11530 [Mycobacteriales bacterium]|nr:hypothetical protein [Mycobacteriales bacterium]
MAVASGAVMVAVSWASRVSQRLGEDDPVAGGVAGDAQLQRDLLHGELRQRGQPAIIELSGSTGIN